MPAGVACESFFQERRQISGCETQIPQAILHNCCTTVGSARHVEANAWSVVLAGTTMRGCVVGVVIHCKAPRRTHDARSNIRTTYVHMISDFLPRPFSNHMSTSGISSVTCIHDSSRVEFLSWMCNAGAGHHHEEHNMQQRHRN